MGRRSMNTTKSGKYMNPTDQARKQARKRELKKNKKQRMAVRAAVLRTKDPIQLIQDLEILDEQELNPESKSDVNEKVIREKRKKIKETFDRVLHFFQREEPEKYEEYRKLEREYDKKRNEKVKKFEAIRDARQVNVDMIPLPETLNAPSIIPLLQDIPLPGAHPPSILKHPPPVYEIPLPSMIPPPPMPPPIIPPVAVYRPQPTLPILGWPYSLPDGRRPPGPPKGLPPHIAEEKRLSRERRRREKAAAKEIKAVEKETAAGEDDSDDEDEAKDKEEEMETGDIGEDGDKGAEEGGDKKEAVGSYSDDDSSSDDDDDDDLLPKNLNRSPNTSSDEEEEEEEKQQERKRSVRFSEDTKPADDDEEEEEPIPPGMSALQARMLKMAGQLDTSTFTRDRQRDDEEDSDSSDEDEEEQTDRTNRDDVTQRIPGPPSGLPPGMTRLPGPPAGMPPGFPAGIPLPPNFRPPPPLRGVPPPPRMIPPGPPPGRPPIAPPGPPPGAPPMARGMPMSRLPPHMIPLPPPRMGAPPMKPPPAVVPGGGMNRNVLSAPPSIRIPSKEEEAAEERTSATIEAKPQIRNLQADVTRFMPTSLRVKRDGKGKSKTTKVVEPVKEATQAKIKKAAPTPAQQGPNKEDAYLKFMDEMSGLL